MKRSRALSTKTLQNPKSVLSSPTNFSILFRSPSIISQIQPKYRPTLPALQTTQTLLTPMQRRSTIITYTTKKIIRKQRKVLTINPSLLTNVSTSLSKPLDNLYLKAAFASKTGRQNGRMKDNNQDALLIVSSFNHTLLAVFDGHGPVGHLVSEHLKKIFLDFSTKKFEIPDPPDPFSAFPRIISEGVKFLISSLKSSPIDSSNSGSTFLSVFIYKDICICSNIGDSKAVLISFEHNWRGRQLNELHRPSEKSEKTRILKAGGVVGQALNEFGSLAGPLRVFVSQKKTAGLSLSRTIGDSLFKEVGVCDVPEFTSFRLRPTDKCFIVATDGLWDYIDENLAAEVVKRVWERGNPEIVVNELISIVNQKVGNENVDDISVIVGFRQ